MVQSTCQYCGKVFEYRKSNRPGHYCSQVCHYNARRIAPEEKFWKHVRKSDGCWEWTGSFAKGYGRLQLNGKRKTCKKRAHIQAHRFSWELHFGPIPKGLFVCHHCDNKRCVRPDHLFLGTASDNHLDAVAKGRIPGNRKGVYGEKNGMSKLTESQVRFIRQEYSSGSLQREIATRYGVTQCAITNIICGVTWKNVH